MNSSFKTPYLKIKRVSRPKLPLNREERDAQVINQPGVVQGKPATAPELMWARGLEKAKIPYLFIFEVPTNYSLPGKGKKIDFIVDGKYADEIDGEFAHKTISKKAEDDIRDVLLSENLHALGIAPIRRIDAMLFESQNRVDDLIKEYYG